MWKSEYILNLLKNNIDPIIYLLLSDPREAFNNIMVYEYLKTNHVIVNWQYLFELNMLQSKQMIHLIEELIPYNNNLLLELCKYQDSINIPEIYNIIKTNKNNINYYYLGKNKNIFMNIIL